MVFGSITPEAVNFLKACVAARLNIVISGGTRFLEKTTLLNVLSTFIPGDERIITVEKCSRTSTSTGTCGDALNPRPPNIEGRGEVTIRQLVINTLRMRPRPASFVGEIRDEAALDMLQAMNTGHDGSHDPPPTSNSPRDTAARIETMVMMAGHGAACACHP